MDVRLFVVTCFWVVICNSVAFFMFFVCCLWLLLYCFACVIVYLIVVDVGVTCVSCG